jgi:hypothetical protein
MSRQGLVICYLTQIHYMIHLVTTHNIDLKWIIMIRVTVLVNHHLLPASVRILLGLIWLWESLSVYLRKVGGLSPNTLYNVSGFSLPPIKTDRHHITERLLSMAKNDKQTNKKKTSLRWRSNQWTSFIYEKFKTKLSTHSF